MKELIKPDSNLSARFFFHMKPVNKDGKPGFAESIYITIRAKGLKDKFSREMKEEDKLKFPRAWSEFEKDELIVHGTPLRALPGSSPSLIHELAGLDIHTVEDLAELQESAVSNVRRGRELQNRAKAYLAALQIEEELETNDSPVEESYSDATQLNRPKKRERPKK